HRLERTGAGIGIEGSKDDAPAEDCKLGAGRHDFITEELGFVNADNLGARRKLFQDFGSFENGVGGNAEAGMRHDFVGGVAFIDGGLEDLHALAGDLRAAQTADQLFTLAGKHRSDHHFDPAHIAFDDVHDFSLDNSYRFSAASASCSLFSACDSVSNARACCVAPLAVRCGSAGASAIHLFIIERSERDDHGNAKCFLAADTIAGKHAPGALGVANADAACKFIDGDGKLDAVIEDFVGERFRQLDASRPSEMALRAVRDVSPTLEENT